jgi:hypothetical protein
MPLQPDADPQHRTLVEREGVNAGSDRSTDEGDHVAADADVIGAPATVVGGGGPLREQDETGDLPAPENDAMESGQDNGSMS